MSFLLSRLVKTSLNIPCRVAQSQTQNVSQVYSRAIQTSCARFDALNEVEEKHLRSEDSATPSRSLNFVTLIGHLHEDPYPLLTKGMTFAYLLNVKTNEVRRGRNASETYSRVNHFRAVCYDRRLFTLVENSLQKDAHVFIEGRLVSYSRDSNYGEPRDPEIRILVQKIVNLP